MARLIAGLERRVAGSPRARLLRNHPLVFSPRWELQIQLAVGGGVKGHQLKCGTARFHWFVDKVACNWW